MTKYHDIVLLNNFLAWPCLKILLITLPHHPHKSWNLWQNYLFHKN